MDDITALKSHNRVGGIRLIENEWIQLDDGCRLAARIWLPVDAEQMPAPAILEYIPYRKRDATAYKDEVTCPYFAAHGYAYVRVDIRGNGESDGLMEDEYSLTELADALQVIDWIARQTWCSGAVGMCGISWGGFNALQVAALAPPALKAIVTLCSTDDRYADDIHYRGGCLLTDNLTWSSQMLGYSSRPPDPEIVGASWREAWLARLEAMPLLAALWLRHQWRDAYWRHGSVCEDPGAIQVPVYVMGGWADAYSNAVFRLLDCLHTPIKALVGPWVHARPHIATPGPKAGYLQESLRWWDHWLKDTDSGFMDEPVLRTYMQDSVRPAADHTFRPGRWVADAWPPGNIRNHRFFLNQGRLEHIEGPETGLTLQSPLTAGMNAGRFCPGMRRDLEHPTDQSDDDAISLVFDSEPLDCRLEIFGAPVVLLELSSDKPLAHIAVRLCDVHPDGASTRVTYGLLNLAHRRSHAEPSPLRPGQRYRITVRLDDVAYSFPPGNRIRVAISNNYWPLVWPVPETPTLTVFAGVSGVELPVREGDGSDSASVPDAFSCPVDRFPEIEPGTCSRIVERDETGTVELRTVDDNGLVRVPSSGIEIGSRVAERFSIDPADPLSARVESAWTWRVGRDLWRTRTESRTVMWSDEREFHLEACLEAFEGDERIFIKTWRESIPRDLT